MRKQLLILSAFLISMTMFGQKDELKAAEKAIKLNDFNTAMGAISQAEGLIANADDKSKAKFYYLKGKALYQNGSAQMDVDKVGAAFNELINFEIIKRVEVSANNTFIYGFIVNCFNCSCINIKTVNCITFT